MKLLSINVGLPREVEWRGKAVRTSIFKAPVPGRVRVMRLNVDGDRQSDLSVHGGTDKAVYAYSSEHYAFWRNRPDMVKRFLRSGRTGFYLAVLREGDIGAGDSIDLVAGDDHHITVADVVALYAADAANQDLLRRASELSALPESWRQYFRERLWEPDE